MFIHPPSIELREKMGDAADSYDVIVAGGGPAGSSASIHLALNGFSVLLLEQKRFPREKLCGEFISPECLVHFNNLGVADVIELAGPAEIIQTKFYGQNGRSVTVPSSSFGGRALGLSRAVMDHNLLQRARRVGVTVIENASVSDLINNNGRVVGVRIKTTEGVNEAQADVVLDATGRSRSLCRKVNETTGSKRSKLIAFKAHFTETAVAQATCEIYAYLRGYGGLSSIEGNLSNLCFIVSAADVRRYSSSPEAILQQLVMKNKRAFATLKNAKRSSEWLSASWEHFGGMSASPAPGLLAAGDSAAFIDPFTGSGMLMAFDNADLVSRVIVRSRKKLKSEEGVRELSREYIREYARAFNSRLRLCSLLRRAAFNPILAETVITLCGASSRLREILARGTRSRWEARQ
jgi:flavin-dependent dehydrogenase